MLHYERRKHRRYLVEGRVVAKSGSGRFAGGLVDVSEGGVLLVTGDGPVPVGTQIEVDLAIDGFRAAINAKGRVARTAAHVVGIAFSDPPLELEEAVLWLEAGFLSSMF